MRAARPSGDIDRLLGALAGRQYGVVSRAQIAALGVGRGPVERRLASGRLIRLHHGVYAVGHRAPRTEARWLAAVLACGDGAALSHRSAAALWEMTTQDGPHPDVTVSGHRRIPGVTAHDSLLTAADLAVRKRIPVTSPARTLVDLARQVDHEELLRAVREAQFRHLFDPVSIDEALERRASRALRALLEDIAPTQSVLEDRLLRICDHHRIPRPLTQQSLAGRRVDFLWPQQHVVVETDGWQGHSTPTAFQSDRATSNALQLAGYAVLRFTHADVARRPSHVARQIRLALAER